jgi:hypothetical protein
MGEKKIIMNFHCASSMVGNFSDESWKVEREAKWVCDL